MAATERKRELFRLAQSINSSYGYNSLQRAWVKAKSMAEKGYFEEPDLGPNYSKPTINWGRVNMLTEAMVLPGLISALFDKLPRLQWKGRHGQTRRVVT